MKYSVLFITSLLLLSCGNSKQATNNMTDSETTKNMNTNVDRDARPSTRYFSDFSADYSSALEIDFQGNVFYRGVTNTSGFDIKEKLPEGSESERGLGVKYVVKSADGKTLTIHIFDRKGCQGGSSKHPTYIEVTNARGEVLIATEGCGMYHNGSGLQGMWVLTSVNGQQANAYLNSDKALVLELGLEGNLFNGTVACRSFIGGYDLFTNKLFISIRQAPNFTCEESAEENSIVQLLAEKELSYNVENDKLTLSDDTQILIFTKKN